MRAYSTLLGCLAVLTSVCAAQSNESTPQISKQILSSTFKPPQVFRNTNLVKNINLDKSFSKETINVIIENIDSKPQTEYYLPFEASALSRIGGFEARDKKDSTKPPFKSEVVGFDTTSDTEFYRITLHEPLQPTETLTLNIAYNVLASLNPLPSSIGQDDKHFVQYTFSAYAPSAYLTQKQKTKLKLPTTVVPDYTILPSTNADGKSDPEKQGSVFTYGPYSDIPAGASELVSLRYEFTKPLTHASLLERDIEVSHWGGNLATEERYWLENRGATLKNQFSRVAWQQSQFRQAPTWALKELRFPLAIGSSNPYFTDDIGNVSTSRWRSNTKEANLELKPRYPVFGGWKYKFRVGWDADLSNYLRKLKTGDSYVLKVPFLEGPKQGEGLEYSRVDLRVILPEGATNVQYETSIPLLSSTVSTHKTFMDTLGRPTIHLTALNLIDEHRDREIIVTYDYPYLAGFRKPLVITASVVGVFVVAYLVGNLDVSIKAKKR